MWSLGGGRFLLKGLAGCQSGFAALLTSASSAGEFTAGASHRQVTTQEGASPVQGGPEAAAGALVKEHLNKKWSYAPGSQVL